MLNSKYIIILYWIFINVFFIRALIHLHNYLKLNYIILGLISLVLIYSDYIVIKFLRNRNK